jgi:hypothetical protein
MTDNLNDVLQELSALLRRISEQNDASVKRQDELKPQMDDRKALLSKLREGSEQRSNRHKLQVEEVRFNSMKNKEISDQNRQEDLQFRERLLQTLEHHNRLLESVIARLKESPKKG